MKNAVRMSLLGGSILVMIVIFYIYATRSRPVLIEYRESDSLAQYTSWALLHPLRDRAPERTAEAFLKTLKQGNCEEAFSKFSWAANHRKNMLTRERDFPVKSWRLTNRSDSSGKVRLLYMVIRLIDIDVEYPEDEFESPIWITLEQSDPSGVWVVVQYDSLS